MSGTHPGDEKPTKKLPLQDSNEKTDALVGGEAQHGDGEKAKPLDPTRYGDWEKNGRCIDF